MPLLLIPMLVGLALLMLVLLVLLMVLLLHVLMLDVGRLMVFVSRGLQLVVLLHIAVFRGWVMVLVDDRLLPLLVGPSVL
jgi:hypothetical protein